MSLTRLHGAVSHKAVSFITEVKRSVYGVSTWDHYVLVSLTVHYLSAMLRSLTWSHFRFEVLTAVKMSMLFFWVVTPCGLVGRYQRFGETCLIFYLQVHTASQPRTTTSTSHFTFSDSNFVCTSRLSEACYMPCPSCPLDLLILVTLYLVKSANYEAPYYVIFSILLLLSLFLGRHIPLSTLFSNTLNHTSLP
jgi:hypothetical protein